MPYVAFIISHVVTTTTCDLLDRVPDTIPVLLVFVARFDFDLEVLQ